jgi:hypothetical protein
MANKSSEQKIHVSQAANTFSRQTGIVVRLQLAIGMMNTRKHRVTDRHEEFGRILQLIIMLSC